MVAEYRLKEIINERYIKPLDKLSKECQKNQKEILDLLKKTLNTSSKEECLLNFRRAMEMLIRKPLLLTVTALSSETLIAIRDENFLQFIDDRYYSPLQLSSFLDIFKIETKDYKLIQNFNSSNDPHIGLIINYILGHYNTTFRKFMNRNVEYYYMYSFFFEYGEQIKEILNYLNAYHYSEDKNWEKLYKVKLPDIHNKIQFLYPNLKKELEKF